MSEQEEILINVIRLSPKEFCAIVLESYIQRYGFLSNEVGDIIKKILEEKEE